MVVALGCQKISKKEYVYETVIEFHLTILKFMARNVQNQFKKLTITDFSQGERR